MNDISNLLECSQFPKLRKNTQQLKIGYHLGMKNLRKLFWFQSYLIFLLTVMNFWPLYEFLGSKEELRTFQMLA